MIVPATRKHIEELYPEVPESSLRAFCIVDGDRALGVAGTYVSYGKLVVFVNLTEEACKRKKDLIRLARKVVPLYLGKTVVAVQDKSVPTSEGLLRHFGFEPHEGEIWLKQ